MRKLDLTDEERAARKKAMDRAYYLANREKVLAREKTRYAANPEIKKAQVAAWWKALTPDKRAEYRANVRPETKANKAAATRRRYEAKRDELLARSREYHYRDHEKRLAQKRAWSAANRALGAHYTAKRRAMLLRATPAWADRAAIEREYQSAFLRTWLTGEPCEVDHIVPLDNKLVCGLHVPANLRVVPRLVNRSKGNRSWPDMP